MLPSRDFGAVLACALSLILFPGTGSAQSAGRDDGWMSIFDRWGNAPSMQMRKIPRNVQGRSRVGGHRSRFKGR
jgi:hypothetical protein